MTTVANAFALLLTLGVAACGAAAEPDNGAGESTQSASAALRDAHPVEVTDADGQRTIVMTEGRPLQVALASNVTTGFDWYVRSVEPPLGSPEITHVPGSGVGAPGTTILTWQTTSCGASTLGKHVIKLDYERPWERRPANAFQFVVDIRRPSHTVVLTETDDGVRLDVLAGTAAEVALPSNPSTGYDWVVTSTTPALPPPVITFTPGSNRPGAPGVAHLRWATRHHGTALVGDYAIDLAYERPWEPGKPAQTFSFDLTVSPTR